MGAMEKFRQGNELLDLCFKAMTGCCEQDRLKMEETEIEKSVMISTVIAQEVKVEPKPKKWQ